MMVRLLHALAALFTVLLLFIRQRCVLAGTQPPKRPSMIASGGCFASCGDSPLTTVPLLPEDCIVCARAACIYDECSQQPKYKRDPDICVDNENIGQHPLEEYHDD